MHFISIFLLHSFLYWASKRKLVACGYCYWVSFQKYPVVAFCYFSEIDGKWRKWQCMSTIIVAPHQPCNKTESIRTNERIPLLILWFVFLSLPLLQISRSVPLRRKTLDRHSRSWCSADNTLVHLYWNRNWTVHPTTYCHTHRHCPTGLCTPFPLRTLRAPNKCLYWNQNHLHPP